MLENRTKSVLCTVAVVVLSLCACTARTQAAIPSFADLAYSTNWRHRIDLYVPQDRPGPFPVVVYFHGGGWLDGDKIKAARYADDLLARGIAVAGVNYRFSYQAEFPAQLHDCKGAIRWLRAHAEQYNLDSSRFAAFGESAGGHLASLVGTVFGDASLEGTVGGNLAYSSRVQAVVHGYGPTDLFELANYDVQRGAEITSLIGHDIYDIIAHRNSPAYAGWVELVNSANPANHAAGNDPPEYIVHGANDHTIPPSQSEILADALNVAGADETFRIMPNTGHELPDDELPSVYGFLVDQLTPLPEVLSFAGANVGDGFGQALAIVGDVNGDGIDDIAVGAPFNDDKGVDAGRVTIQSGSTGAIIKVLRGRAAGDRFGFALAGCGDVNGDGVPDVIIGSPLADARGKDSGRVEVFSGSDWRRVRTFSGEHAGDQCGYSVAAADVDDDGLRDIVCGAPFANQPAADAGVVVVYSSAGGALMKRIRGLAAADHFGWSVSSAGDVDGDGRSDIVIGAPLNDAGGNNAGSVTVVGFDGVNWVTRMTQTGAVGEQLGYAVSGIGDANGDGLSDIIAGAPKARTSGWVPSGVARIYAPSNNSLVATLEPADAQNGEEFGIAVSGAGDIDGDGRMDVLVGAPKHDLVGADSGRLSVFSGLGVLLAAFDGGDSGAKMGKGVAGRADIDGNGHSDVIVGATGMFSGGVRRGVVYILEPVDIP